MSLPHDVAGGRAGGRCAGPGRDLRLGTSDPSAGVFVTVQDRADGATDATLDEVRGCCNSGGQAWVRVQLWRLKEYGVERRADVDLGARVGVVPPGAPDAGDDS